MKINILPENITGKTFLGSVADIAYVLKRVSL